MNQSIHANVRQRNRLSLQDKKDIVNNFYQFLNDAGDNDLRLIAKDLAIWGKKIASKAISPLTKIL
jgi:hypothetical protein